MNDLQKKIFAALMPFLEETKDDQEADADLFDWLAGFSLGGACRCAGLTQEEATIFVNDTMDRLDERAAEDAQATVLKEAEKTFGSDVGEVMRRMKTVTDAILGAYPPAERTAACAFMIGVAMKQLAAALVFTSEEEEAFAVELQGIVQKYAELGTSRNPNIRFGTGPDRSTSH